MINEYNAKRFCKEDINLIENYEEAINDDSSTWDLHHRRELTEDGEFAYSREDLKKMNLYYQRPANELIFLRKSEHRSLHKKGKKLSEETKAKLSAAQIGNTNSKGRKRSAETKQKLSESLKKYWQNRRNKKEM